MTRRWLALALALAAIVACTRRIVLVPPDGPVSELPDAFIPSDAGHDAGGVIPDAAIFDGGGLD